MKKFLALILAIATMAQAAVLAAEGVTVENNGGAVQQTVSATPTATDAPTPTQAPQVSEAPTPAAVVGGFTFHKNKDTYYVINERFMDFNSNGIYTDTLVTSIDGGDVNLMPVRAFAESLGNTSLQSADDPNSDYDVWRLRHKDRAVIFQAGRDVLDIYINNAEGELEYSLTEQLSVPVVELGGVTYIPFREIICHLLGWDVAAERKGSGDEDVRILPLAGENDSFGIVVATEGYISKDIRESNFIEYRDSVSTVVKINKESEIRIATPFTEAQQLSYFKTYIKNNSFHTNNYLYQFENSETLLTYDEAIGKLYPQDETVGKLAAIIHKDKCFGYTESDIFGKDVKIYTKGEQLWVAQPYHKVAEWNGVEYYSKNEKELDGYTRHTINYGQEKSITVYKKNEEIICHEYDEEIKNMVKALDVGENLVGNNSTVTVRVFAELNKNDKTNPFDKTRWIVVFKDSEAKNVSKVYSWNSNDKEITSVKASDYKPGENMIMISDKKVKDVFAN